MKTEATRCFWAENVPDFYRDYHDNEWGVPIHDDKTHFEFLILEGAQAGLSWSTVLKRRESYRKAFAGFDPEKVAAFSKEKMEKLMQDPGIIRNKLKISAAVTNSKLFLEIQKEFGSFDNYIWGFTGNKTIRNKWKNRGELPATSAESDALSRDLKKRGFKFCGSTIMYAHMQACGLVNDHLTSCFRYKKV